MILSFEEEKENKLRNLSYNIYSLAAEACVYSFNDAGRLEDSFRMTSKAKKCHSTTNGKRLSKKIQFLV